MSLGNGTIPGDTYFSNLLQNTIKFPSQRPLGPFPKNAQKIPEAVGEVENMLCRDTGSFASLIMFMLQSNINQLTR